MAPQFEIAWCKSLDSLVGQLIFICFLARVICISIYVCQKTVHTMQTAPQFINFFFGIFCWYMQLRGFTATHRLRYFNKKYTITFGILYDYQILHLFIYIYVHTFYLFNPIYSKSGIWFLTQTQGVLSFLVIARVFSHQEHSIPQQIRRYRGYLPPQ